METDVVSWLPPKHPRASISEPAAKRREKLLNPNSVTHDSAQGSFKHGEEKDDRRSKTSLKNRERDYRDREEKRHKYDDKDRARRKFRKDDLIDPMDPAAYSDVPQVGTWIFKNVASTFVWCVRVLGATGLKTTRRERIIRLLVRYTSRGPIRRLERYWRATSMENRKKASTSGECPIPNDTSFRATSYTNVNDVK